MDPLALRYPPMSSNVAGKSLDGGFRGRTIIAMFDYRKAYVIWILVGG